MKILVVLICAILGSAVAPIAVKATPASAAQDTVIYPYQKMGATLPGTEPLSWGLSDKELSRKILDGAHEFIDSLIGASVHQRAQHWTRDFSSVQAYNASVAPNRKVLMHDIGVVDKTQPFPNYDVGLPDRYPSTSMERFGQYQDSLVAETSKYRVYQVRWPVLDKVWGVGLLVEPKGRAKANIVALPDADISPEQLMGLAQGVPAESQFARRLAENGYRVLVPLLISRDIIYPGTPKQQTYREWIYRQAFHMGRHIIGFGVQKTMAAVDWFKQAYPGMKVGVAGYGEGGLVAFYAAALDTSIDAVLVSGYFHSLQQAWLEPIYRNVWNLLSEFGGAEIATLIAPRPMVVEYSHTPSTGEKLAAPPLEMVKRFSHTRFEGAIPMPDFSDVQNEFNRIDQLLKPGFQPKFLIAGAHNAPVPFGSERALEAFSKLLGDGGPLPVSSDLPVDQRTAFDPKARMYHQMKQLEDNIQGLAQISGYIRNDFFLYKIMPQLENVNWTTKLYEPYYAPDKFIRESKGYRDYFWKKIIGKFEQPMRPPDASTKKVMEDDRWTGYRVVLPVYNHLYAAGVLLLPKDLRKGERRPVVVIQHGRNGVPREVIEGHTSYNDMGAKLANQGFIVFATFGLFNGEDRYRWLCRKANAVGKTLFSFILSQNEQYLNWLKTQPFVDSTRIAFYGKSYGGETAMRVPSILQGYCLSICSGDFGDWTRKVVDTHFDQSFVNSFEWEMPYFNMGTTFSYAEMAYLIFPRPFMVERGHHDLVQPDDWVASEFAKVRYVYAQFGMPDKVKIEFFNGGHTSKNDETFDFLHQKLNWP